jgi:S1-C subfamily serine protease
MKRWLMVLALVVIVWPAYIGTMVRDQNDVALDNLRSEMSRLEEQFITQDLYIYKDVANLYSLYGEVQVQIKHSSAYTHQHKTLDLSVLDSCGIITNGQGHGSCVAIRSNLMLTAGHCIGIDGTWIEVGGQQYRILKQWKSKQYDVGFVEIEGELPFVELAGRDPELLDEVFLVGSPYNVLFERSITKGVISHLERHIYDHVGLIQTDAEGAPGSSGCPLFCERDRIIGICVAGPNPGGGVVLCEPVEHIRQALEEYDGGC